MANVKISDLTAASAVADANQFEINEAGSSKRVTAAQIKTYVGGGTTTVATISALEALTSSEGDMVFVTGTNGLFIKKTAGWYKIADVANDQLESVTVTMSGGGTAGDPYLLALDGTDTLATGAATDPEGLSVTWSAAAISPATLSGNNIVVSSTNVATITQGTGANSNVFTLDPVATTGTYNFSVRFSVTDGINATINTDQAYTLNFITTITDSKYTTLLAQAVGSNNGVNSLITDSHSSSSPHTISNTGTPVAGTFSPYRGGGYSAYFTGSAGDRLTVSNQAGNWSDTGTATIEFWFHSTRTPSTDDGDGLGAFWGDVQSVTATRFDIETSSNDLEFRSFSDAAGNGFQTATIKSALTPNTWYHLAAVKDGQVWKFYLNGTLELTHTQSTTYNYGSYGAGNYNNHVIGQTRNAVSFQGYITDVRVNSNKVYTAAFPNSVPTERLTADSNTTFFYNGTGYIGDTHSSTASNNESITVGGDVATKPIGPYDYSEYAAADYGGSIYFNRVSHNSGDCITVPDHNDFTLSTSNWTVKFWVYHDELSTAGGTAYGYFSNYYYNTPGGFGLKWMQQWGNKPVLEYMNSGSYAKKIFDFVPSAKIWYYYELTCSSSTVTFKVNGETIGTQSMPDLGNPDRTLIVGSASNGSSGVENFLGGYIADFQYVIGGTASESSVPTAPMTTASNSKLHLKGTDGSIIDKSGSDNLKLVGDTKCTTTAVVYNSNTVSSKSMYFDGNGDGIVVPHSDNLNLNGCDWTIEFWYNVTNPGAIANWTFIQKGDNTTTRPYTTAFRLDNNNGVEPRLFVSPNNSSQVGISNNAWQTFGNWHHVAFVRIHSTGVITRYINGQANGTVTSDVATNTEDLEIGTVTSASDEAGYIQDIRVSKGKAHYTGNFNPPTAPLEG